MSLDVVYPSCNATLVLFNMLLWYSRPLIQVTSLPFWITEIGTNDMTVQGVFPYHTFAALVNTLPPNVFCPVVLWFCWSDAMVSPFGLVDTSNNPKPSYYSFTNFTLPSARVL